MPSKIYAVRIGRQTGIFKSWSECEAQVKGYPGAKFKSFTAADEAMRFVQGTPATNAFAPRKDAKATTSAPPPPSGSADYVIYTDGSCLRNPDGPGGWGVVLHCKATGERKEYSGGTPSTTNNRMEMTAAIRALESLPAPSAVEIYTDSQYLKNAFTKYWLENWKKNGWKTAAGAPVRNRDLWEKLNKLYEKHRISFQWVKGHVGIPENERCDLLARTEAMKYNTL